MIEVKTTEKETVSVLRICRQHLEQEAFVEGLLKTELSVARIQLLADVGIILTCTLGAIFFYPSYPFLSVILVLIGALRIRSQRATYPRWKRASTELHRKRDQWQRIYNDPVFNKVMILEKELQSRELSENEDERLVHLLAMKKGAEVIMASFDIVRLGDAVGPGDSRFLQSLTAKARSESTMCLARRLETIAAPVVVDSTFSEIL